LHARNRFFNPAAVSPGVTVDQVVSLREVPVPEPMAVVIPGTIASIPGPGTDLNFQPLTAQIVQDNTALIQLGKALFWDMQVGSDGVQSCATCHFSAGADIRARDQISPNLSDANFHANIPPSGSGLGGDNMFGNSTVPYTANDPNTPNPPGPVEPAPAALNVPGHPQFNPNYQVNSNDFPLNDWFRPTELTPRGPGVTLNDEFANASRDTNDIMASQGVRFTTFVAVQPGSAVDKGTPKPDIFNTSTPGVLNSHGVVRRAMPRNAPTMINAVFNFDNLWEGRGSFIFNGANSFGFRDRASQLQMNVNGVATPVFIRITNSSLASVAVGPPLSNIAMSYDGRTFPDVGKKMVSLRPLALQFVHPQDSVLGPLSRAILTPFGIQGQKGLKATTYADMIKAAFQPQWWNLSAGLAVAKTPATAAATANSMADDGSFGHGNSQVLGPATQVPKGTASTAAATTYTQMELNFSLFFGLAVQAYEATLVSDQTPFDAFMGAPNPVRQLNGQPCPSGGCPSVPPNPAALTTQQSLGLTIFTDDNNNLGTHCADCHIPPVTTGHTVLDYQPDSQGVPSLAQGEAIEFMIMGDNLEEANYDHGMYNIGIRRSCVLGVDPSTCPAHNEDKGRGATAPNKPAFQNPLTNNTPFPLSLVELTALRESTLCNTPTGCLPPDVARFIPNVPMLPRRVTNGAFKAPNLRNIKFSGPYFHVGDSATLRQVVEFYTRGGNFPNTNLHDKTVDVDGIPPLAFPEFNPDAETRIEALVSFLAEGLKDSRVAFEQAPFDHPQLIIPNGSPQGNPGADVLITIPPVGMNGRPTELPTFLGLDPQQP
jgi:cytochrome c peroxidase